MFRISVLTTSVLVAVCWAFFNKAFLPVTLAQETSSGELSATEVVSTEIRNIESDRTERMAWGLSETDWSRYRRLMSGPSGLWYSHLAPTVVLGINAESDAERQRFARIVFEQERQRLDDLFAFNRAYQQVARNARNHPGFSLFEEQLLHSPLRSSSPLSGVAAPDRITAFVGVNCPQCDRDIHMLTAAGKGMDIYVVGADSDQEIRTWASRVGIPVERVVNRSITLNHGALNLLDNAGHQARNLPLFFTDSRLETPADPASLLRNKP